MPAKKKKASKKKAPRAKKKKLVRFDPPPAASARPAGPAANAWACAGRNANRSSWTPVSVAPPLEQAWRVKVGGRAAGPPVVAADGAVYVADKEGGLAALDVRDGTRSFGLRTDPILEGSPVWPLVQQRLVPQGRVPISAAPLVLEWHLLWGDDEGIFYCARRGDATVLWKRSAPLGMGARTGGAYRAALGQGDQVAVLDAEGNLHVADARGGATAFSRFLRGRPAAAPALGRLPADAAGRRPALVVAAVTPLYPGEPSALHAIDLESGERVWRVDLPGLPGPALATTAEQVLVGGPGGVRSYRLQDGSPLWAASDVPAAGPVAHDGNTIVVPSTGGALVALDAATGERRWIGSGRSGAPVAPGTGPAIGGELVWTAAEDAVVAWRLGDGAAAGRVRTPGTPVGGAVLAGPFEGLGPRLLVATETGSVAAFGPG